MGFIAPFIPLISAGVGALGSIFGGKAAQSAAEKGSPQMQAATAGATSAANTLGAQGGSLFGQGTGIINQGQNTLAAPTNYFSQLLSGNRAQQAQAIAAPRAAITDTYSGAARGLTQAGVRGATRDVALGQLQQQKASQIGSLITGVQPGAASALTGIGQTQTGQGAQIAGTGVGATQAGGNIFANLLGPLTNNSQFATQQGNQFGSSLGSLLYDVTSMGLGSLGKSKTPFPAPTYGMP